MSSRTARYKCNCTAVLAGGHGNSFVSRKFPVCHRHRQEPERKFTLASVAVDVYAAPRKDRKITIESRK